MKREQMKRHHVARVVYTREGPVSQVVCNNGWKAAWSGVVIIDDLSRSVIYR